MTYNLHVIPYRNSNVEKKMTAISGIAGYNWSRAVSLLLGPSCAVGVGVNIGDV